MKKPFGRESPNGFLIPSAYKSLKIGGWGVGLEENLLQRRPLLRLYRLRIQPTCGPGMTKM